MRKRTIILIILMILTGLSLLLYPTVSDYLKNLSYRRAITDYIANVEPLDDGRSEAMLADARAFNEALAEKGGFVPLLSVAEQKTYDSLLDIDGTGVMGYVSIPKVNISLPVYHGTSDAVLQHGVGHLEGSSLPVGGTGTHAALSAHTGLPSAKLFTNIDQLVLGDSFTVQVLKETLTYEVDQILVVLPDQTEALNIEPGEDYCTLVTCTPYGVNSHRLLVRGRRVPTPVETAPPTEPVAQAPVPDEGYRSGPGAKWGLLICVAALLVLLAAGLVLVLLRRHKRKLAQAKHLKRPAKKTQAPPEASNSGNNEERR